MCADGPSGPWPGPYVGRRIAQAVMARDPDFVHVNGLGFGQGEHSSDARKAIHDRLLWQPSSAAY
jgi:hypothetical protein